MNEEINIPDSIRQYLNEIAERLWAERPAVMVGFGFSKNAGKEYPNWNQLGNAFQNDSLGVRLAQLLPEVISRLCFKCTLEAKHHIFDFIVEVYRSPNNANYRNMKNLTYLKLSHC